MNVWQMFVAKSERGRGLGDVLLFETLNRRCKTLPRSHLYVSSRNTPAVAIYHKFGFKQSNKPSGDISHDLVSLLAFSAELMSVFLPSAQFPCVPTMLLVGQGSQHASPRCSRCQTRKSV